MRYIKKYEVARNEKLIASDDIGLYVIFEYNDWNYMDLTKDIKILILGNIIGHYEVMVDDQYGNNCIDRHIKMKIVDSISDVKTTPFRGQIKNFYNKVRGYKVGGYDYLFTTKSLPEAVLKFKELKEEFILNVTANKYNL